jgi:hypothetical protein
MKVRKIGNTIIGADLTAAERKALNLEVEKEVKRSLAEMDKENTNEIDAMVLWVLHEQFGFGPKRLKRFHDKFIVEIRSLIKRYGMDKTDTPWLCRHKLERYGINLDEWNKDNTIDD